jgi:hypothetical protein
MKISPENRFNLDCAWYSILGSHSLSSPLPLKLRV